MIGDPSAGGQLEWVPLQEDIPAACFDLTMTTNNSTISRWFDLVTLIYSEFVLEKVPGPCRMCRKSGATTETIPLAQEAKYFHQHPVRLKLDDWKSRPPHEDAASQHARFSSEAMEFHALRAGAGSGSGSGSGSQAGFLTTFGRCGPHASTVCVPICGSEKCKMMATAAYESFKDNVKRRMEVSAQAGEMTKIQKGRKR